MVEILDNNLSDYEENILSFWILDMFIESLKTAQDSDMNHKHQKVTLLWIAFMFNYIQKNNLSRGEMFKYLFSLILPLPNFEQVIGEYGEDEEDQIIDKAMHYDVWMIPLPPSSDDNESDITLSLTSFTSFENAEETESSSMKREILREINIDHMKIILEILYRIFSRFWVFKALQIIFHETPLVDTVDLPFTLNTPKPVFQQETLTPVKSGRSQKKQQEEEEIDLALYKNDFILPLQLADGAKIYVRQLFNIPSKETIPASTKKSKK